MQFLDHFKPELTIESPGRINIIGEHTDYNMGFVLPTAIEKKITFQFQKNGSDKICHVYSKGYDTGFELSLDAIEISKVEWENYILGVLNEISKRSDKVRGFDCVLESHVPIGSGVSSSAALECGLAFGLNEMFDLGLSRMDIVELSQAAEHTYAGTKCGIMDQFASVMSKEGHVILLDCESLEYSYIPIQIQPYKILLLNTNVSHNLVSGEYNKRRTQCEAGVAALQKNHPEVKSLRNASMDMLNEIKDTIDDTVYNRCAYVIQEKTRVLEAVEALKANNLKRVGELLYETHEGLSTLYEVSCPELDFLVDFTKNHEAVLGARMMGGGFGGCTINLIHEDALDDFVAAASKAYKKAYNLELSWFEASPSKGTSILK
ncbi:galactokinase [Maribacter polysiphoniae]|uniref:Galactokinase n=1 Tax=Maribacter polysiphoniae TaxID=429344 RepID=A0A316DXG3_9FLAO|nr:galactokinase [Maribacter polysiphoniae]MBD1259781.1 galactokinase [Maribacter polysiphoniae]PWK23077.1 galactokinase [Maribacter polysiphoniae]